MKLTPLSCLLSATLLLASTVNAQTNKGENREQAEQHGWLYGIGLGVDQGVYKDFDSRVLPIPLLGYRSENLTVFGPFVNYSFYRNEGFELSARLVPTFEGYDESDSEVFNGMEDRDFSIAVGLGLAYEQNDLKFEVTASHDVLDRSGGYEAGISLSKVYRVGAFFIEPSISLNYQDSHYVDYYYGVEQAEATSNRARYDGKSAVNKAVGISVMTPAYWGGMSMLSLENVWYDDAIADSPLTDKDSSLLLMMSYSRFF